MALDKTKTNAKIGFEIHKYLVSKGVETPIVPRNFYGTLENSNSEKIDAISKNVIEIMNILGLDLKDDSLQETPKRVAKMYLNEIFWGLDYKNFPKITTVENKMKYDEMVLEKNIQVMSTCEHHLVTIAGKAHIAYIPKEKVIGLSKLNRIVEFFAKRPQIQERLTEQIYYALSYILETENIAIIIDAEHYCIKSRGVEDINSSTTTSKLGGIFKQYDGLRQEFLKLCN